MNYRRVDMIVIHCSATKENSHLSPLALDRMHRLRWFNGCGYHFYIGTFSKCPEIMRRLFIRMFGREYESVPNTSFISLYYFSFLVVVFFAAGFFAAAGFLPSAFFNSPCNFSTSSVS